MGILRRLAARVEEHFYEQAMREAYDEARGESAGITQPPADSSQPTTHSGDTP